VDTVNNHRIANDGPVLVTGANGLIGRALVLRLLQEGYSVHALVRHFSKAKFPANDRLTLCLGDITQPAQVAKAMEGCDYVFHTAAMTQPWTRDRAQMYKVNLGGTRHVLDAAMKLKVKRVVFTSSCAVAGPSFNAPLTEEDPRMAPYLLDYEISKKLAEDLVTVYREKGLDVVMVSPTKVFGEGIASHSISLNSILSGFLKRKFIVLPSPGDRLVSLIYLNDVVQGHMLAMWKSPPNEKYFLSGHWLPQSELFRIVAQMAGVAARVIIVPKWLARAFGYALFIRGLFSANDSFRPEAVKTLFHHYAYSSEKAQRLLGLQFTPLDESLRNTVAFLTRNELVAGHIAKPVKPFAYENAI
jgi:nucleoside-diphosphate-sugar epimerase